MEQKDATSTAGYSGLSPQLPALQRFFAESTGEPAEMSRMTQHLQMSLSKRRLPNPVRPACYLQA